MKRALIACLIGVILTMCSCTPITLGIDGLVTAPKLSDEQINIHEALTDAVGSNITLKFPQSGSYRSAYIIQNIDDEPGDEAIVFYEYSNGDKSKKDGLMLNILDKDENDDWHSVKEISGAGSEVSQVIIAEMGNNHQREVVVGYTGVTGDEKAMEVYNYKSGSFKTISKDTYSLLEAYDIDSDGNDELITISKKANKSSDLSGSKMNTVRYAAYLTQFSNGKLVKTEMDEMCSNVTSYVNSTVGSVGKKAPALFIDSLTNENQLQTEILYYKDGRLAAPLSDFFLESNGIQEYAASQFTRPVEYYSQDIDKDGVIEIPSAKVMPGYENVIEEQKLYLTSWYTYNLNDQIKLKCFGYYSINDRYIMAFPTRWDGKITVQLDSKSDDVIFCKLSDFNKGKTTELMRISIINENNKNNYLYNGYKQLAQNGKIDYVVKIADIKNEPLVPTIDEVKNLFYVI